MFLCSLTAYICTSGPFVVLWYWTDIMQYGIFPNQGLKGPYSPFLKIRLMSARRPSISNLICVKQLSWHVTQHIIITLMLYRPSHAVLHEHLRRLQATFSLNLSLNLYWESNSWNKNPTPVRADCSHTVGSVWSSPTCLWVLQRRKAKFSFISRHVSMCSPVSLLLFFRLIQ